MSQVRIVCFDWGGVILRHCRSWQEGCAAAGLPVHPEVLTPEPRDPHPGLHGLLSEGLKEDRFPGPGGPADDQLLARMDRQVDVAQDVEVAEPLVDLAQLDHRPLRGRPLRAAQRGVAT